MYIARNSWVVYFIGTLILMMHFMVFFPRQSRMPLAECQGLLAIPNKRTFFAHAAPTAHRRSQRPCLTCGDDS